MKAGSVRISTIVAVSGLLLIAWAIYSLTNASLNGPPFETAGVSSGYDPFPDWIICWHGRGFDEGNYEFLIAYPEEEARGEEPISLTAPHERPWLDTDPEGTDAGNDSLKMCYFEGFWYGGEEPWESALFPSASHLRIVNDRLQVCDNFCDDETKWSTIAAGGEPPAPIISLLNKPVQGGVHISSYLRTGD